MLCLFLTSPARGAPSDQLLSNEWARGRALGKWRVPKPVVQSLVSAGLQALSCVRCAIHAVALVPYFEALEHPGLLQTVWHRHYRQYMLVARGRGLSDLLWSKVDTLAEFTTPWRVSAGAADGSTYAAPHDDCFLAPWSRDSASLLDSEVRCHGSVCTLRDLLQEWREKGCSMHIGDSDNILRCVALQIPTPFLFGLLCGTFDFLC